MIRSAHAAALRMAIEMESLGTSTPLKKEPKRRKRAPPVFSIVGARVKLSLTRMLCAARTIPATRAITAS
jgi:hypothetical protein